MPLTKPEPPARNQIKTAEVKHWSKHWNVEPKEIQSAIAKVGNSVAAVEKELGLDTSKKRSTTPMESQPMRGEAAAPMSSTPTKTAKSSRSPVPVITGDQAALIRRRSLRKQRNQFDDQKHPAQARRSRRSP